MMASPEAAPGTAAPALYLHFPWCVRKCPYCDFNSHPLRGPLMHSAYREALEADLSEALEGVGRGALRSVFCGGGTPSLFPPEAFAALIGRLGPRLAADAEITLEANPGTLEHHALGAYRAAGINRLSLGAQSFDGGMLAALGRIHAPEDTERAFHEARRGGFDDINLDLMYGLPAQTPVQALADLERAIALAPDHLSWYQLTLEPKTEFARRPPVLPDEDALAEIEAAGLERLDRAGYRRYEISAFARPGRECRHNLNYWRFGDYIGAGAGAHGKITRRTAGRPVVQRTRKPAQPRRYLAAPTAVEVVEVSPPELPFEFLMNALRLVDGVPPAGFERATGLPLEVLEPSWQALVEADLLREDRLAATPRGLRYLDSVLQRFLR